MRAVIFRPTIGSRPIWIGIGVLVLLSIFAGSVVVYETGGTAYPYPHVLLLPVILSAAVFKVPGGLIAGLIAGLSVGPYMPLDVDNGVMQATQAWIFRLVMFLLIGGFTGLLSTLMYQRQQDLIARERIDPVSGLLSPIAALRLVAGKDSEARLDPPAYAVVIAYEGLSSVLRALGIEASNKAIFEIGQTLQAAMGPDRLVTRIHGATFAVTLPKGRRSVHSFAKDIERFMPQSMPIDTFALMLLPRYGVAKLTEEDRTEGQAFRKAMAALNLARNEGRRIARYRGSYDHAVTRGFVLLSDFERALRVGELRVHFQPKVNLATGKPMGVEALIRWRNSFFGNIPPAFFVPIIEKTNLIDDMTRFVAQTAMADIAALEAQGFDLELALNIAPSLLTNTEFMAFLKALPGRYGIAPARIELEITETALMDDTVMNTRALEDLHAFGFRLAIDDFGTGYSSMLYLKNFPMDTVKLDQSFVRDLPDNQASAAISSMTAAVCKRMGTRVVAEGVETRTAEAFLEEQGFDIVQGYLYARPMSSEDLLKWLTRQRAERTGGAS
ncbi:bifunctional diguanylate cyclase/phosphodiesterase [Roseicyclus marinus]|uniref:bifunctional diguanylate cyclase/phosphodiesterase n=1 Tax=Roseicyclus marinus TaxID=2161673 RepID=UPI0024109182|nr:EAL domain-containing protein [Roseicyclus marinus]MDG3043051.1 EAL domain-containing protein [Roseicyclus marinus]